MGDFTNKNFDLTQTHPPWLNAHGFREKVYIIGFQIFLNLKFLYLNSIKFSLLNSVDIFHAVVRLFSGNATLGNLYITAP